MSLQIIEGAKFAFVKQTFERVILLDFIKYPHKQISRVSSVHTGKLFLVKLDHGVSSDNLEPVSFSEGLRLANEVSEAFIFVIVLYLEKYFENW